MSETTKALAEPKPFELRDKELDEITGGMPAAQFQYFMNVLLPAWAKEQGSKPVQLPGL